MYEYLLFYSVLLPLSADRWTQGSSQLAGHCPQWDVAQRDYSTFYLVIWGHYIGVKVFGKYFGVLLTLWHKSPLWSQERLVIELNVNL